MSGPYYIGWDVGGWSCTTSRKSCDALVVLDDKEEVIGNPHRNSLKPLLNESNTVKVFLERCFELCGVKKAYQGEQVCLAIDTPLGYSTAFIKLITNYTPYERAIAEHSKNPYLFRATERHLFDQKIVKQKKQEQDTDRTVRPLSAVNDMIGAQSTKGIHLIAKLEMKIERFGVWKSKDKKLTIIETYPSVNFEIAIPAAMKDEHQDIQDAYRCAYIAYLFQQKKDKLVSPTACDISEDDIKEGWIWYLKKEGKTSNKG